MRSETYPLRRRRVVESLLADRGDLLVVAGLGAPCWDVTAAGDHALTFPLWGAMGSAALIGLGLALAGPRRYADGTVVDDPWIGGGSPRARPADMRRGLWIYAVAYLILTGLVAALLLLKLSA